MHYSRLVPTVVLARLIPAVSSAWSFSLTTQPEACVGFEYHISGGTPPYAMTLAHMPDVPPDQISNISSWSSGGTTIFNETDAGGDKYVSDNTITFTPLVMIGSDSTGFATGGTSEAFTVQPDDPPVRGCTPYPGPNNTDYLSYLAGFSTNLTECGQAYIQLKNGSFEFHSFWIDTIVPLGQSFRTEFDTGSSPNRTYTWPIRLTAGTNVSFIFDDGNGNNFVTPLMTVQPGSDTSCNPQSTISASPTTLPPYPTGSPSATATSSAASGMRGHASLPGAAIVVVVMLMAVTLYS